ncbi:MAG: tetratricopeptide repeat protein [Prevotellaceae bacterium]|nr:tetratricopeptide repeat protein [Prevotellaceae bacterium]
MIKILQNIIKLHVATAVISVKMLFFCLIFLAGCSSIKTTSKIDNNSADLAREYYLISASQKFYQGDLFNARQFLLKSISVDPDCSACYYLLSNVLLKSGYASDALIAGKKAFALDSANFWYGRLVAQIGDLTGDIDLAVQIYQYLMTLANKDDDIAYSLGALYCRQNQFDKALTLYDSLQNKSGFDERILFARQQIYYATGNNSAAMVEALRYFERDTENPQANLLLAEVFVRGGNDSVALQYLERAHELDETYAAPLLVLAEMYRKKYEYDKFFGIIRKIAVNKFIPLSDKIEYFIPALQFWQEARYRNEIESMIGLLAENYGNEWDFKQFYSSFLIQTDRHAQAMNLIDEELQQNKRNNYAWNMKIALLYYSRNLENVLSAIDTALVYSYEKSDFLLQKASILYELKRYSEAISVLENTLKSSRNITTYKDMLALLGDAYHAVGNKKSAYRTYEKVLAIDTANIGVLNNYAYYLSEENRNLQRALEMSQKTINAQPENATFLDTYAWILHKLGRDVEAQPVFRKAMTLGGRESAVILDHYGDVLFELKEYTTAILYWEDSLSKADTVNVDAIHKKIEKCKKIKDNSKK